MERISWYMIACPGSTLGAALPGECGRLEFVPSMHELRAEDLLGASPSGSLLRASLSSTQSRALSRSQGLPHERLESLSAEDLEKHSAEGRRVPQPAQVER